MVEQLGAHVLFGRAQRLDRWRHHLRNKSPKTERWRYRPTRQARKLAPRPLDAPPELVLPLAGIRGKKPLIVGPATRIRRNDEMLFAYMPDRLEEARTWLESAGWESLDTPPENKEGDDSHS
jgi:hypothetical protein